MNAASIILLTYSLQEGCDVVDGTLKWDKTILVLVEIGAGDREGLGYSYADVRYCQQKQAPAQLPGSLVHANFRRQLKIGFYI